MNDTVKEKLAESLTSDTTDILPYLPYLLQDFWELGSSPEQMLQLFRKHIPFNEDIKVLDLACGKGAVSVKLAKELNIHIKGIDLIPEFIDYARRKAIEYKVDALCDFEMNDANSSVKIEHDYDCVIFGAVGDILGNYKETISKLLPTIKSKGFILIDDAYVVDKSTNEQLNFERVYPTYNEWCILFKELGLKLIECIPCLELENDVEEEMNWIITRANELIKKYPSQKDMFEQYVISQKNEYTDLQQDLVGATWILQKE
ncbi:TPA: class I SAM-dependent methyltransferase [Clostridioides difficile]|nr:class I SAM-dependent methyltransferase [Clostridioides difficile]